jgi:hypothetical protein
VTTGAAECVWDRAPGAAQAASQLEDQVQRVAKMLGTTGSALRVWVLANRAAVIGS